MLGRDPVDVYLDANAVGNLLPKIDTALSRECRERLKAAVSERRLRVIASASLLQELLMIGASSWSAHARIMVYLREVAEARLLMDTKELGARELRLGRGLRRSERFVRTELSDRAWRAMADRRSVIEVAREVDAEADRFVEEELRLRDRVLPRLRAATPKGEQVAPNVWRWWIDDSVRRVREFAEATARARVPASRIGAVKALPAFWHFHAYKVARIALTLGRRPGGGIARGDAADAHHYTAAAYVEVFVSDDRKLRQTAAAIEGGPQPLTLAEFARMYLR